MPLTGTWQNNTIFQPEKISPALQPNSDRFHKGSGTVRFFQGWQHSPAPKSQTQRYRCWEYVAEGRNVFHSSSILLQCLFSIFCPLYRQVMSILALAFLSCHGASRDGDLTGFGGLADVRQNALVRLLRWPWHTADGGRMAGSHRASSEGLTSTRKARPSALKIR